MRSFLRLFLPATILYVLVMVLTLTNCGGGGGTPAEPPDVPPNLLSYERNPMLLGLDLAVEPNVPSASQAVDAWSIAPALPAGLLLDPQSGSLSGLPTELAPAQTYTVTAVGPTGSSSVELSIAVVRPDSFAFSGSLGDESLSVHVVDPESGFVRPASYTLAEEGASLPRQIVVHPGGTPVYVVHQFSDTISVYDFDAGDARLTARAPVTTAPVPVCLVLHPDGSTAYLASLAASTVQAYAIDPETHDLAPAGDPVVAGDGPFLMAIDPPGQHLYVGNHRSMTVRVFDIDPATHQLQLPGVDLALADVPISMQLAPDGRFLFVLSSTSANLSTYSIDPADGGLDLVETRSLPGTPMSVVMEPSGNFLYVAVSGPNEIHAFDLDASTGDLTPIGAAVSAGLEPSLLRSDNTGRFLYAVQPSAHEVAVFAIEAGGALTPVQSTRTRELPVSFALACTSEASQPEPRYAYVANSLSNDVSAYGVESSTGALSELGSPALAGLQPSGVALDLWSRALYVANAGSHTISSFVIEPETGQLSEPPASVPCGLTPQALCVEPSGRFLYVANRGSDDVASFALGAGDGAPVVLSSVPVGSQPVAVCCEGTGRFLYVANQGSNSITSLRIDVASGALAPVGPDLQLGGSPRALRAHPDGRFLFATLEDKGELQVLAIDAHSGVLTPGLAAAAGSQPTSVAVDPLGRFAFVTDFGPGDSGGLVAFALDAVSGLPDTLTTNGAGLNPIDTALDAGGRFLYVASQGSDEVHVLAVQAQTGALSLIGSVPSGVAPCAIAVSSRYGP